MAAIVKANPSLTAGGLAVLRRSYSTTDDGTLNYEADYVCLSPFASNHIGKFRTGAQPPTAIPASMSQLRIDGTPKLYDFSTSTHNGLTYFNGRYSAASLDPGEVIVTESQEQRNFSATVIGTITTAINFGGQQTTRVPVPVSFDYISTTVRVEAKNPLALPNVQGSVGREFNVSVGYYNNEKPTLLLAYVPGVIETQSKTKSSRGNYTYSKSSTGIYEVNQALF
jgi:hypothetical protein